jgi:hypothetical protein
MAVIDNKREMGRVISLEDGKPRSVMVFYRMQVNLSPGTMIIFRAEAEGVSIQASNMGDLKRTAIPVWADTLD